MHPQLAFGSNSNLPERKGDILMNSIIYLVGLVVVVMFVLSFFGLR